MSQTEEIREIALVAKVTESAEKRLESYVKRIAWIFASALAIATLGGWIRFERLVESRVDNAISEAERPFIELKESASKSLAEALVESEELSATIDSLRPEVEKVSLDLQIVASTPIAEIAARIRALNDLEPAAENLVALQMAINELSNRLVSLERAVTITAWVPFDWEGNTLSVPDGWRVCDGNAGVGPTLPNLNGRFLIGVTDLTSAGVYGEPRLVWRHGADDNDRRYLREGSDIRPPRYSVVYLCRVITTNLASN